MSKTITRVRIAPSPTGSPHIGTAYIALFNYAFAKKNNGKFILRIENTDKRRSSIKNEQEIFKYLKWLNLDWDEGPNIGGRYGPYRQNQRLKIYQNYIKILLKKEKAYLCNCTKKRLENIKRQQKNLNQPTQYDQYCRYNRHPIKNKKINSFVVRLKTPEFGTTKFYDLIRGFIEIQNSEIDDQVLLKQDNSPTYHLANVIDDHLMKITHVIRGEEWITSTAKHILLYSALRFNPPIFIHLPLIRNPNKSKISKRNNPVTLKYFQESGYFPEALLNFLGLIAFSFGDNKEMFTLNEFIQNFSIKKITLGEPVFNINKLIWLNGKYLREKKTNKELTKYIQQRLFSQKYLNQIISTIKERINKSEDFIKNTDFFFTNEVDLHSMAYIIQANRKKTIYCYNLFLEQIYDLNIFSSIALKKILENICNINNIKKKYLFMSLRIIITGKCKSSPLLIAMKIMDKDRVIYRIKNAIKNLEANCFI